MAITSLAQKPNPIAADPRAYMMLIYGDAGIGKTSWAAEIPGHYFAKTEDGTQGVEVFGDPITSWEEFIDLLVLLRDGKESGWEDQREVRVIVVDTYERLYALAGQYICSNERFIDNGKPTKFDRIEDVTWGKGYARVNELLINTLVKAQLCGFGIVLLSHTKERTVKWRSQPVTMYGPNLSGSASEAITGACGIVARYMAEEEVSKDGEGNVIKVETGRYMLFEPEFQWEAKHRLKNFGTYYPKLKIPAEGGWQVYCDAFNDVLSKIKESKEASDGTD